MGNPFSLSSFLTLEEKIKNFSFGSEEFRKYFRTDFIEKEADGEYMGFKNGRLYATTILFFLISIVIILALSISQYKIYYIFLALCYFMVYNLIEYFLHRYPMHRKNKFFLPIYKHVVIHHNFFANEKSYYEHDRDCMATFLPGYMFLVIAAVTFFISFLIFLIGGLDNALFYALIAAVYYLAYELFHFLFHFNENNFVKKIPGIKNLAQLHMVHHNTHMMSKYNFNITIPICDKLFGTLYHKNETHT